MKLVGKWDPAAHQTKRSQSQWPTPTLAAKLYLSPRLDTWSCVVVSVRRTYHFTCCDASPCLPVCSLFLSSLSLSLSLSLYISSVNALTPWVVCVGNRWFLFIFIFWSLKRKFCINQFLTIKNIYIYFTKFNYKID